MVPLGKKRAASCPSSAATRSSSRRIVGSPSRSSSPTSAVAMAARMAGVGFVTVSLRRSIAMRENVVARALAASKLLWAFSLRNLHAGFLGARNRLLDDRSLPLCGDNRVLGRTDDCVLLRTDDRRVARIDLPPEAGNP